MTSINPLTAGAWPASLAAKRSTSGASPFADMLSKLSAAQTQSVLQAPVSQATSSNEPAWSPEVEQLRDLLQSALKRLYTEQGIDESWPTTLTSDHFDGVQVSNDHPDADRIEQLFADHPELGVWFNQLQQAAAAQAPPPAPAMGLGADQTPPEFHFILAQRRGELRFI